MAVSVVSNPKFRTGRLIECAVGFAPAHFTGNSGFGEFPANIGDLMVVG